MGGTKMAQKSTIYKAELSVSDMDRHYYETHKLTVAKHPSETDERMMLRLLAFALHASKRLEFSKGISTDGEPDLWEKNLNGETDLWISLGLPSEKLIRQSCGKAKNVIIYAYGGKSAEVWWNKVQNGTARFKNLSVINVTETNCVELGRLARRSMQLQVNIQDCDVLISVENTMLYVTPTRWKITAFLVQNQVVWPLISRSVCSLVSSDSLFCGGRFFKAW